MPDTNWNLCKCCHVVLVKTSVEQPRYFCTGCFERMIPSWTPERSYVNAHAEMVTRLRS